MQTVSNAIETTRDLVEHNGGVHADLSFLAFEDEAVTDGDLDARSNAVANYLLKAGVGPGDVVAYMLGNSPPCLTFFLARTRSARLRYRSAPG